MWAIISKFSKLFTHSKLLKSLKLRIFIMVLLIGIIPMVAVSSYVLHNFEKHSIESRMAQELNQCTILSNYLAQTGYLNDNSIESVNGQIEQLSDLNDGRVMIIDDNFKVISDTYRISLGKTLIATEVIKCFQGETSKNYDENNGYIEIAMPITDAELMPIGAIMVSASTDSIMENVERTRKTALVVGLVIITLILILDVFLSDYLLKPFERITAAISSVEAGYNNEPIAVGGYSEMDSIMDAFNLLLTRMKTLDDSRSEFVSNVSHELKTPMTSMKVLADSLLSMEDAPIEMYREFMNDIAEEVDRENNVINDLLTLVRMDKKDAQLNIENVSINEMIERILKMLKPLADEKNVELIFESLRDVTASVDEVKLSLSFMNLVENAIKYNKDNGWVRVTLDADHQFFILEVADCGIGIPEENLETIFERFYRVDKSHSGEIEGTGLGLAISRAAIIMHRGAIKANSIVGEGTIFTVRIPLSYVA